MVTRLIGQWLRRAQPPNYFCAQLCLACKPYSNKAAIMSYYDIDAILTDSQKLPCTFELDVPGLGYLDGNAGGTVRLKAPPNMTIIWNFY